jgi:hypothetical protein
VKAVGKTSSWRPKGRLFSCLMAVAGLLEQAREVFDQVVDELADLCRMLAVMWHDGPYTRVATLERRQHIDQLSPGKVRHDVVIRQLRQPQPFQRCIQQGKAGVGMPGAAHANFTVQPVDIKAPLIAGADEAAVL